MLSESKRKRHPPVRADRKRRVLAGMAYVERSAAPKDNEAKEPEVRSAGSSLVLPAMVSSSYSSLSPLVTVADPAMAPSPESVGREEKDDPSMNMDMEDPSEKGEGTELDVIAFTTNEPQPAQTGLVNSPTEITQEWLLSADLFEQDADVPLRHIGNLFEEEARKEPAGSDLFHADFK